MLSNAPGPEAVRRYVDLAHRLAQAALRAGRFHRQAEIGVSDSRDLALDAIADLFERNDQGGFPRLDRYFESLDWETLSPQELWTINRRLISGVVADATFRNYRLSDPSLARVIRNTKRGVLQHDRLVLSRRFQSTVITTPSAEDRDGASWTPQTLAARLIPFAAGNQQTPAILDGLGDVLETDYGFSGTVRLSVAALAIRECGVHLNVEDPDFATSQLLSAEELDRALEQALRDTVDAKKAFYLRNNKLSPDEFEAIRNAVESRIRGEVSERGGATSNFDAFHAFLPAITHSEYRTGYRNVFEYLYQLTFNRFCDLVRSWVEDPAA